MLGRLILLVAFLIAVLTVIQLLRSTPKSQQKNMYWKLGLGAIAVALVLMAVTGRIHWISAVFGAMLPFVRNAVPLLLRYFPLLQHYRKTRSNPQPSAGNSSQVQTAVLLMTLDHDSNHLTGEVISGPFSGQHLDSLNLQQLQPVLEYCQQQDHDSAKLLISYLNHRFGSSWQTTASDTNDEQMTVRTAYSMLGLSSGASKEEIVRAHRKMMQKVHPDHGGSDYLAAQVNEAKEILLKRLE